ncbi:bifunctional phosphopantothenoylcysteine decarboxylase/phosphopantothenate--cysteine ligase CoaBC [Collinsella sp. An307]|uniref:bifunctional phosphopantothenoylcysteine decarboxylase/phosphopantothenate--cysteine ligase CoaBC n=1 Tax=Collinsella sp. An307 TaxID=1965630 RepID=UPI000B397AA1|nr:bifunctional phosphopantothenoylcysteine decarboxylase/phosphopantothenate--cysteine ligase CoaBC [Collinsella sp. An307]OUO19789.1 phosphopantothenoylcysteine decarboxylase [Collinsella sp. An307]
MGERDDQKTVLVCVTGCIAAYKSCEIVRLLQKQGIRVKVLMTEHATQFVGPTTFRALTHEKVAIDLFDDPTDPIHHISLAQEPDLVLVAPATANVIAKMAHGIADDLMSTTLLATEKPVLVAPAMNAGMWRAEATRENVETLRRRGVTIVGPGSGYLACGDVDTGRLADPEDIVAATLAALEPDTTLANMSVLITAGPTFEPIDPVRFIGNRSSGKMGAALAETALKLGARSVTLVLGPSSVEVPVGVQVQRVETAADMLEATEREGATADIIVCAAAVADYRPRSVADCKIKKAAGGLDAIELVETTDILGTISNKKGERTVIGFAAETNDLLDHAQAKLSSKGCDAIVANDVTRDDSGFGTDTNKAWWVTANGTEELPTLSKAELAREIWRRAAQIHGCSQD